jgi:hypothetical protein
MVQQAPHRRFCVGSALINYITKLPFGSSSVENSKSCRDPAEEAIATIINHHQSSSSITNHHQSSTIINNLHDAFICDPSSSQQHRPIHGETIIFTIHSWLLLVA